MNQFDARIGRLQKAMKKDGFKAYVIPATDPHLSEMYAPRFGAERFYFCPFKGEDGTVLVTQNSSYLFTDGRYWVEAEAALRDTKTVLMRAGKIGVPSLIEFVKEKNLYPLGLDMSLLSTNDLAKYGADKSHSIRHVSYASLVDDMPPYPMAPIFKMDSKLFTKTRKERIAGIVAAMTDVGAKACLIAELDDIAYVLGYRGNDVPFTPVFYSYLYVKADGTLDLFVDSKKLPKGFAEKDIRVHSYDAILPFLDAKKDLPTSVDPNRTNALLSNHCKGRIFQTSPAYVQKSVKGPVELDNIRRIHVTDGLAVLKLMKYVDETIDKGDLNEEIYAKYIDNVRLTNPNCFELSFGTIAAVDSNAAMMHYGPSETIYSPVSRKNQVLLVDSGGQYYGGTTDITRTFILSKEPNKNIIHDYTLTLKSQIALSTQIIEQGSSGHTVDIAAREVMWKEGLDYKCGTGHGVGYMSAVHEGPVGFRYYDSPDRDDKAVLVPGHLITIEPGVYKDYQYGIRLENELVIVPAYETDNGVFYRFETVTYCPYDARGIDVTMLSDAELNWYNAYAAKVCEKLSPLAEKDSDGDLLAYLKKVTTPLRRG